MIDKIKNKTIIVIKNQLILVITPYLHSPLVCLLCVCSDINIIIAHTKESRIAEENRGS